MTAEPPYRFDRTATAAGLHERYADLPDGTETGDTVSVAGRMLLRRVQGKAAFGTVADPTGRIQIFARSQSTPRYDEFCALSLGDWIGVTGTVMKTRRGEVSVTVDDWCVLAEARRRFPDKWHGLVDVDTRYRQRYLDLWVSEEARETALARARVLSLTRRWLEDRRFVEVETPVFHPIPGGATARPFTTHHQRSTSTSTSASLPSSTSSAWWWGAWSVCSSWPGCSATRACRPATTPSSPCSSCTRPTPTTPT